MDLGWWGIIAVLLLGTAVVLYGWWSDHRRATAEAARLLQTTTEGPRPNYLPVQQALQSPPRAMDETTRAHLTTALQSAPRFPVGWADSAFVTDPNSSWAVVQHPAILVCDEPVVTVRELLPALRGQQSLVILAPDFDPAVLEMLAVNLREGTRAVLAVRTPDPTVSRQIASLTGALPIEREDLVADYLPASSLGRCESWVSDRKQSWVVLEAPEPQVGL